MKAIDSGRIIHFSDGHSERIEAFDNFQFWSICRQFALCQRCGPPHKIASIKQMGHDKAVLQFKLMHDHVEKLQVRSI